MFLKVLAVLPAHRGLVHAVRLDAKLAAEPVLVVWEGGEIGRKVRKMEGRRMAG